MFLGDNQEGDLVKEISASSAWDSIFQFMSLLFLTPFTRRA